MVARLWQRLKDVVVNRILGVDDTPQRIAFGVFLGFLIAWTPTIGFQIVLYVAIASLLRANKVVGIPVLFISNPLTAVPMYWFCWWVGSLLVHAGMPPKEPNEEVVRRHVEETSADQPDWYVAIFTSEFWENVGSQLWELGGEMWLGSLVVGIATGVPAYFVTLHLVRGFRHRRGTA